MLTKCFEFLLNEITLFFSFFSSPVRMLLILIVASRKFNERIFFYVCRRREMRMFRRSLFFLNKQEIRYDAISFVAHTRPPPENKTRLISWEKPNHTNHRKIEMVPISGVSASRFFFFISPLLLLWFSLCALAFIVSVRLQYMQIVGWFEAIAKL